MTDLKDLSMVVNVNGIVPFYDGPVRSLLSECGEALRANPPIREEVGRALMKTRRINNIDGQPVTVNKLSLTGQTEIDRWGVEYTTFDGQVHTRTLKMEEFYRL
jgi:hypothetical protein